MEESLLHFIWRYQHFTLNGLKTHDGETIEIVDPGFHNTNSGPDFTNAKIRIGNTIWAGNVEIHIKSSDWFRHNHHTDPAYNNVILHVVVENDKIAETSKGEKIQTLAIPYPKELSKNFDSLINSKRWLPCSEKIKNIDSLLISSTIDRMLAERLEDKTKRIDESINQCHGSWEEAFYQEFARSFGLKNNAMPFQLLAKITPLKVLAKHKNSIFQIEALLLGQSGLLKEAKSDEYVDALKKEYTFLRKKFNLSPIEGSLWKFLRQRPASFPTIRIALLAKLIHCSSGLFAQLMEVGSLKDIEKLLKVDVSDYWQTHYIFGEKSITKPKHLGSEAIKTITINSIIPFMFAYGRKRSMQNLEQKALELLQALPAENNSIIKNFSTLDIKASNAYESQALIHLKNHYCDTRKCIYCPVGVRILGKLP
ncbi:DUF2851 family protein [Tenuifilum thalassicum]|uniref:DUF2851 family protein n=1 Tax=Tenuifilum thalassicum TaxID=2590900 RepID=A0A7D3XWE7_9BACT|nr:DUF2851 family protein [Tenuifilum thalassicum]QKG80648.1 DUF2851 family protein [Tenuifilum thalassicum]